MCAVKVVVSIFVINNFDDVKLINKLKLNENILDKIGIKFFFEMILKFMSKFKRQK